MKRLIFDLNDALAVDDQSLDYAAGRPNAAVVARRVVALLGSEADPGARP